MISSRVEQGFSRRRRLAESNVVGYRACNQHRLLTYEQHVLAQPLQIHPLEVVPVQCDHASSRVVEPLQQ